MREYSDIQAIKDRNFFLYISGEPLKEEDLIARYLPEGPTKIVDLRDTCQCQCHNPPPGVSIVHCAPCC